MMVALCLAWLAPVGAPCEGQDSGTKESVKPSKAEPELLSGLTRLSPKDTVWFHPQNHFVVVEGTIVLREGPLEMFACLRHTKEHESIVAVDSKAFVVHAALLAVGAEPGAPVQFAPEYRAATGTPVTVEVVWNDVNGKMQRVNARRWIRDFHTGKTLDHDWVFAGSGFWTDPETQEKHYNAEGGDLICVANFPTAMLDLPVKSSQLDADRSFQANTKRIPPLGTRVYLVLTPQPAAIGRGDQDRIPVDTSNPLAPPDVTPPNQDHPPTPNEAGKTLQVQAGSISHHLLVVSDDQGHSLRLPYVLSTPPDYSDNGTPAPLILHLHGLGECGRGGDQIDRVRIHGPWKGKVGMEPFPFVVVAPQCPPPKADDPVESYRKKWQVRPLMQLLDYVESELNVDTRHVYLMGLSMGGYGTWRLAAAHPERFAAAVPICGGGDPQTASALARIPIWAFHGQRDSVVPVTETTRMIEAIRGVGGNPQVTIYPDAEHDSWTRTFANAEVFQWLLTHEIPHSE